MKRNIHFLILFIVSAFSVSAQNTIEQADSAYTAADYARALQLYNEILEQDGSSAELYYNIGNSYYRTGNLSQAIIFYERALRLDPTMTQARENLEFVNSKIIDKPGERFSFVELAARNIALHFSSNTWAWLGLILFLGFIALALLYYFTSNVRLRKVGFFGGAVVFVLSVFCIAEAFYGKRLSKSANEAIITAKSTILSTSPRTPVNSSEEAMLLHEGTKVYIQDSIGVETDSVRNVWYDVKVDNDHRAWISKSAVEKI